MPMLKKPGTPAKSNPDSTPAPSGKKDSFAARLAASDAKGGGFIPPDPGQYNAIITDAVGEREDEGIKETAYLEYTIHDPNEPMHNKSARIYFNFTKDDGTESTGMPYFKAALEELGYDTDIQSWEGMLETLAEIAKDQPWIIVDVKKKGAYTNSFINSVPANQKDKPRF